MTSHHELRPMHSRQNTPRSAENGRTRPTQENSSDQQKNDEIPKCPTYFEVYCGLASEKFKPASESSIVCPPGRIYETTTDFRHKDSLGRVWIGPEDDRYLSPTDGRLAPLIVQATTAIWKGPANSTWARSSIEECTPIILRIVYSVLGPRFRSRSIVSLMETLITWVPSSLAIALLLFWPTDLEGETKNNGHYEQFKYHYWGYAKVPTNLHEIPKRRRPTKKKTQDGSKQDSYGISERPLRPIRLCLLDDEGKMDVVNVEEWEAENETTIEYIFVCYTAEQFRHTLGEHDPKRKGMSEEDIKEWNQIAEADMIELHDISREAARAIGVSAYWVGCSCIPPPNKLTEAEKVSEKGMPEPVYRISDIVRGARSLVVAVGSPQGKSLSQKEMLQQLGKRLWTFPEVLLSPSSQLIWLFPRDGEIRTLSKRDLAMEAWDDGRVSRQLIDHYEGSLVLSPLELVSIALECFPQRQTWKWKEGDLSYALMGLLRRRPNVDEKDSSFEAFCRLSLANDSDQLLERLICMLPKHGDGKILDRPWYNVNDNWDSNLWDIEPHCQVVGLGGEDTVILSGAFGAPIRWKSFQRVNLLMRNTLKRSVSRVLLRSSPTWLILGVSLLAGSQNQGGSLLVITIFGWVVIGLYLLITLASPYMIYSLYCGKTWAAQPWLFGFEGHMELGEIEKLVFGINLGRLRWSPYSSELSVHDENEDGECEGKDPTREYSTDENSTPGAFTRKEFVSTTQKSKFGELKLFTLVDTNTFTVTLFRAVRPPVTMLLCGSEGGMERALLCSYDWKSQTLFRETVLRVQTVVLEKMSRVDRFRLGLKRPVEGTVGTNLRY